MTNKWSQNFDEVLQKCFIAGVYNFILGENICDTGQLEETQSAAAVVLMPALIFLLHIPQQ